MGNLICYLSIFEIVSLRYSTGAVSDYSRCGAVDLAFTIPECYNFRLWYDFGKFQLFSRWEDGDVWGSDFRDASNGDLEPSGGSDIPEVYFFAGHGSCQDSPNATSPDFISVCGRKLTRISRQSLVISLPFLYVLSSKSDKDLQGRIRKLETFCSIENLALVQFAA